MTDEIKTEKAKANLYKIGFFISLILLAFFLGVIFHGKFVSATWELPKAQTCTLLNLTGDDCEKTWCGIIDCTWNETKGFCACYITINNTQIINNTVYVNVTQNITINETTNFTNATLPANLYTKEEVDNMTRALRDSLVDRLDNTTQQLYSNQPATERNTLPDWVWLVGFISLIVVIGIFAFLQQRFQKEKLDRTPKVTQYRKKFNPNEFQGEKEEKKTEEVIEEKPDQKPKKRTQTVYNPKTKKKTEEVIEEQAEQEEESEVE